MIVPFSKNLMNLFGNLEHYTMEKHTDCFRFGTNRQ
jgi:hypothetical protein